MTPPAPERRNRHRSATSILLRRYHEQGDHAAREQLIELYLPLVSSFTGRYAHGSNDYDDLYQVGCIGLINAIDRFEFERGDEFAAFAVPNIAGEIKRYLRDRSASVRLPRRVHELRGPAVRLQAVMRAQLGRAPTAAELAERLGARESDVELALSVPNAAVTLEGSPEPNVLDPGFDDVDDRLFLVDATRELDERQRRILYLRYVRDLEPEDVARELGISQRQLSRATRSALRTLRTSLEDGRADERLPAPGAEPKMARVPTREGDRKDHLDQPYSIELTMDVPGGGWTAQVKELPGCSAQGSTPEEAARGVEDAMRHWIAQARAEQREIPRPRASSSHSGRLLVRMPQSLHAELARAAAREEVSLNQFITSSLASAVGWRQDDDNGGLRAAIVANIVVLAILAVVAIALLVIAFARGF